ncbi:MAG TPA: phosphoribosyltransferase family protein [Acidimicrobiales bacterium]|jgi:orotate phosphoribosyltransferase
MELANLALGLLGLVGGPTLVWFFGSYLRREVYGRFGSADKVRNHVRGMVRRRSFPYSQREAGTFVSVPLEMYVDFLSASCDPRDRQILDRYLTRWIGLQDLEPTLIAVPKLGNVVLASTVARRLGLPLVVVYQGSHDLRSRTFDGVVQAGERVLVVDDVSADATFHQQVIERLQRENVHVVGVVVLVDRPEGGCARMFEDAGIPFFPVLSLDDAAVRRLHAPRRARSAP